MNSRIPGEARINRMLAVGVEYEMTITREWIHTAFLLELPTLLNRNVESYLVVRYMRQHSNSMKTKNLAWKSRE